MTETTASYFDQRAGDWSDHYKNDPRFERRYRIIQSVLDEFVFSKQQSGSAIDVGCGSGIFTELIATKGWFALGVDISSKMIAKARARIFPNSPLAAKLSYEQGSVEDMNSYANSYDLVVSFSALEYIPDDASALDTIVRLAKQDRFVVLSVPNRKGLVRRLERLLYGIRNLSGNRLFAGRGDYLAFQKHQYARRELDQLMQKRGMKKISGRFLNAAVQLPESLLGIFEREWWAAMYLGCYQKTAD